MLLTLISEFKNLKKNKELKQKEKEFKKDVFVEEEKTNEELLKDIENLSDSSKKEAEDNLEKEENTPKKLSLKEKRQKNSLFGQYEKKTKKKHQAFFKGFELFIVLLVIFFFLSNAIRYMYSSLYPISGTLKDYGDGKVVFIPEITKINKTNLLKDLDVGDVIYFEYKNDSWIFSKKKKGLKLKVIEENSYYYKFTILNLKNIVIDKDTLKNYGFSTNGKVTLNLKKDLRNYSVYFDANSYINKLRKQYNIKDFSFRDLFGE